MFVINYNLSLGQKFYLFVIHLDFWAYQYSINSKIFLKICSLPQHFLTSSHIHTATLTLTRRYVQNTLIHIIVHQGVLHFSKYKNQTYTSSISL